MSPLRSGMKCRSMPIIIDEPFWSTGGKGDGRMHTRLKRPAVSSVCVIMIAVGMAACSMQPSDES